MAQLTPNTWQTIEQTAALAASTLKGYTTQAVQDGKEFLASTESQTAGWLAQVAAGAITPDNFASLVRGQASLAQNDRLKQAGLAQVAIDSFVNGLSASSSLRPSPRFPEKSAFRPARRGIPYHGWPKP